MLQKLSPYSEDQLTAAGLALCSGTSWYWDCIQKKLCLTPPRDVCHQGPGTTMPLKTLLKRKDKVKDDAVASSSSGPEPPEFVIMRSDTNTQEILQPPSFAGDSEPKERSKGAKRLSGFRAPSDASATSRTSSQGEKRLSQRLHLRSHSRASSAGSFNVPTDLPSIDDTVDSGEEKEAKWEERATILAKANPNARPGLVVDPPDQLPTAAEAMAGLKLGDDGNGSGRPPAKRALSDAQGDVWDTNRGQWRDKKAEADPGGRKISKRQSDYTKPEVSPRAGHIMMSQPEVSCLLMSVCVISRSRTVDRHVWSPGGPEKRPEPGPLRSRAQVSPWQTCPLRASGVNCWALNN